MRSWNMEMKHKYLMTLSVLAGGNVLLYFSKCMSKSIMKQQTSVQ